MCAAGTTAVGMLGFPATPPPWSFWASPPAVEALTVITPRPAWAAVGTGALAWGAFVRALPGQNTGRKPNPSAQWDSEQLCARQMTQVFKTEHY